MNVSLTTELETFVHKKVKSGNYKSASEVIREGLRLLSEQDELRHEVMKGVEEIRSGKGIVYNSSKELADDIISTAKKSKQTA